MKSLDVVNACLRAMGQRGVQSLTVPHPYKDGALSELARTVEEICAPGWWFNRESVTLYPDASTGEIRLPHDIYSFRPAAGYFAVERGGALFNTATGSNRFSSPVSGVIIRSLEFDALPSVVRSAVGAEAVARFHSTMQGDSTANGKLREVAATARISLDAEETRQARINLFDQLPQVQFIRGRSRLPWELK